MPTLDDYIFGRVPARTPQERADAKYFSDRIRRHQRRAGRRLKKAIAELVIRLG